MVVHDFSVFACTRVDVEYLSVPISMDVHRIRCCVMVTDHVRNRVVLREQNLFRLVCR